MNTTKVYICFSGNLSTVSIAQITALFSHYNINILDINMFKVNQNNCLLNITCEGSSTTDEIDSFWDDLSSISKSYNLIFSKKYIE